VALGPTFLYRLDLPKIPQHHLEDFEHEWKQLLQSIAKTRIEIEVDRESVLGRTNPETAAIFEAHLVFLDDEALLMAAHDKILDEK